MENYKTPKAILEAADSNVRNVISKIFQLEEEEKYTKNLSIPKEKEISDKIIKVINEEIRICN